ncbi:MAG: DUF3300 domain-containing protein [Proteobacteria bacterium]|nr:DUF3300 domain-containing protein [Pseudomonadota bacterium]
MNARLNALLAALATAVPLLAPAQTPVDDDGNVIGTWKPSPAQVEEVVGNEDIPLLSATELEDLVGPIALYPDDLLAVVLPAAAYPLQIVDAARFLGELENDASLEPDPEWDDSVVALLNYPEILEHLNEDIDWTWRLGEAVVAQQTDVVSAIERFRDRAYAAGNLKSDPYQTVSRENGAIEISPVSEDVIYVPYYEPERVVVYQPRPVYYYYPRPYPVYYYPYASSHHFDRGFFWGVTTAFTIGWLSDSLHVYHHSYYGHPYYGRSYWDRWWYRRPSVAVYNTTYVRNRVITRNRYYDGDRWHPRIDRRHYVRDKRVAINRDYRRVTRNRTDAVPRSHQRRVTRQEPIAFRERSDTRRDRLREVRSTRGETPAAAKKRESVRHIRPERRETVRQVRPERRETAVRPQALKPQQAVRQVRPQRVSPQRAAPQQAAPRRSTSRPAPQRREARPAPQRRESRRSESRSRPEDRRSVRR